jgi:hypothetical protein
MWVPTSSGQVSVVNSLLCSDIEAFQPSAGVFCATDAGVLGVPLPGAQTPGLANASVGAHLLRISPTATVVTGVQLSDGPSAVLINDAMTQSTGVFALSPDLTRDTSAAGQVGANSWALYSNSSGVMQQGGPSLVQLTVRVPPGFNAPHTISLLDGGSVQRCVFTWVDTSLNIVQSEVVTSASGCLDTPTHLTVPTGSVAYTATVGITGATITHMQGGTTFRAIVSTSLPEQALIFLP